MPARTGAEGKSKTRAKSGTAVLVIQSSNELNSPLGQYIEPEFSLVKSGFVFYDGGCGALTSSMNRTK